MNFQENKIEIGIGVLVFVLVAGVFRVFNGMPSGSANLGQDVSYEMPRPKSDVLGEFSLGDREIDRQLLKAKIAAKAAEVLKRRSAGQSAIEKAKVAAKAALAKKAAVAKKNKTEINIVQRAEKSGLSGGSDFSSGPTSYTRFVRPFAGKAAATELKAKMSAAQWRELLMSQPTRENVGQFAAAVRAGEADASSFNNLMTDFLSSGNLERQKLALYGLELLPTAGSFAVASKAYDTLPTELQVTAESYMNSFALPARHAALAQALMDSDVAVVLKAANVVVYGIEQSQVAGNQADDNGLVRVQSTVTSMAVWARFIPIFQQIFSSGDSTLSEIASQVLSMLGSSSNANVASF